MENALKFKKKIEMGQICFGTGITFTDSTVTEALCSSLDFVWIDMEHNGLSLETVQAHIMATKGSDTAPLVRVRWNDPVLIKPVLDIGAAGVIVPMVRTAEEAARAVSACLYPPQGIRGFGPRRPSNYGRDFGPGFCQRANETLIVIAQIEHIDAVHNIDEILKVPGLSGIVMGPYDLSGTMGHMGEPNHPEVRHAIDTVISKSRNTGLLVGMAVADPDRAKEWVNKGVNWLVLSNDFLLLVKIINDSVSRAKEAIR